MPSIVGNIKINSVSQSSNVQIGDTACIVLSSSSRNYGGAAAFSPGDSIGSVANNENSSTNTIDPNLIEGSKASVI
ncbi:spore germination protein [Paenibacillus radicis (ex Xue et al. 2023)]|uniref:Spore germination protein n=1 Tax=Paenibacillus radicis (ex Xue et al. 2023) TaxID=2972489 RepID=A0ABT1YNB5_9BACL|nr:spore germination protein [Paenibacillus radicis (ex Xue et al. 2023)]MCR8634669.1 spore germination protein [Paenibacillus radicis (ex Xue et al. 2023)]